MRYLQAPNEPFIKQERGHLTADAASGSNITLSIDNTDGIAINDYVCIGDEGSNVAELCQVTAVTNTSFTVSTLKRNHKADELFTKFLYNQRKFYGSTSATGSFTELVADGSPKYIQVVDPQGTFFEYTGNEGYTYFKSTYYNSTTNTETDIAEATAILADETVRYTTLYDIRKHAGLTDNPFYPDLRIEVKRKQAENEIDSVILARYLLPLSEVPALISQICELLAAGYIDFEEFGANGQGVKWLGEARSLLKGIADGKRVLIGSNRTELTRQTTTGTIGGYPDDSATAAQFSMDDTY